MLKILLILILVLLFFAAYLHFKAVARVNFYAKQGIRSLEGYDSFFVGNGKGVKKYQLLRN